MSCMNRSTRITGPSASRPGPVRAIAAAGRAASSAPLRDSAGRLLFPQGENQDSIVEVATSSSADAPEYVRGRTLDDMCQMT
jgi:hypothetical protein